MTGPRVAHTAGGKNERATKQTHQDTASNRCLHAVMRVATWHHGDIAGGWMGSASGGHTCRIDLTLHRNAAVDKFGRKFLFIEGGIQASPLLLRLLRPSQMGYQ